MRGKQESGALDNGKKGIWTAWRAVLLRLVIHFLDERSLQEIESG